MIQLTNATSHEEAAIDRLQAAISRKQLTPEQAADINMLIALIVRLEDLIKLYE